MHWIVTSHGGSVETTVTDAGTTMTISIPRQPATNVQEQLTELTQARDKYEAAFEEAYDAMVIINDEARIIDANRETSGIYGLESQELLGQPIPRFLPEEFNFESEWQEFQQGGRERDSVTVVGADGTERRVEYTATADIIPGQHLLICRELTNQSQ